MEFRQIKCWLYFSILIVSCLLLLLSCGGGNSTAEHSFSYNGALSFMAVFHQATGNLNSKTAVIDCPGQGITSIEASVYDTANKLLASGGPWGCDVGQGIITSVPAGSGRTVVV